MQRAASQRYSSRHGAEMRRTFHAAQLPAPPLHLTLLTASPLISTPRRSALHGSTQRNVSFVHLPAAVLRHPSPRAATLLISPQLNVSFVYLPTPRSSARHPAAHRRTTLLGPTQRFISPFPQRSSAQPPASRHGSARRNATFHLFLCPAHLATSPRCSPPLFAARHSTARRTATQRFICSFVAPLVATPLAAAPRFSPLLVATQRNVSFVPFRAASPLRPAPHRASLHRSSRRHSSQLNATSTNHRGMK